MSVVANRYASALVDVLGPHMESGLDQLRRFAALLQEHPDARRLLEDPTTAGDRRNRLLREIAAALGFDRRVANFIRILAERNRLPLLDDAIDEYERLMDRRLGIVRARVLAARSLDAREQTELKQKMERATGKQVRMEVAVDASLIGGIVAQIGSTVYDGSVRQQLQAFKNQLVGE